MFEIILLVLLGLLLLVGVALLVLRFHQYRANNRVTEEEVISVIQEGARSGEVQEVEQDIMERVLVMGDLKIDSLMTHRSDLVTLDVNMGVGQVENVIRKSPFAAYPLVDGSLDEIRGIVTLKDLVLRLGKPAFNLMRIARQPVYFPENMTVYKALEQLKVGRMNRALVCDEFGSVQGIISLKDILEGLVGAIEVPTETPDIVERSDGRSWVVSGQCAFYDFLSYFDMGDRYTSDFATVGGLILEQMERIPEEGDNMAWGGFTFRILKMDENRIDKILVKRL